MSSSANSKGGPNGCLFTIVAIIVGIFLLWMLAGILDSFTSPEEKKAREEARWNKEQHEKWQKDQEDKDKDFRPLYEAAKQMDEYKRVHGHSPE